MISKLLIGTAACLLVGGIGFFSLQAKAADKGAGLLEVGAALPPLTVELQDGRKVALSEETARYLLVYFYPKADTPGCTAQACSLRDAYTLLQEKGVRIYGVSRDGREAQAAFKEKYNLPFDLVADTKGEVVAAFGVPLVPIVGIPKRQAYLFKDGVLIWRDLSASTKQQADDILKTLEAQE